MLQAALTRALRDLHVYRLMVRAALDQLHAARVTIDRQQSTIDAQREEIRRYTRGQIGA